jgi:hypothetical protein
MMATEMDTRSLPERDAFEAWVYAANCLLYESDPGPAQLNVGSRDEPKYVDRREVWRDYYAQAVLMELEADHGRLAAAAAQCHAELAASYGVRRWATATRRRLSGPGRLRDRVVSAAKMLLPVERERFRESHRCALDLCERAGRLVEEAGALDDDTARRRLLAGTRHQQTVDTLGIIQGVTEQSAAQLIEDLRRIVHND